MSEAEKKIREKYNPQWFGLNGYSEYKAAEFGYQLGHEEAMKQVVEKTASAVYIASKVAMTSESKEPSQDELWEEMFRVDEEEGTQEVKKRYRITRITS